MVILVSVIFVELDENNDLSQDYLMLKLNQNTAIINYNIL